MTDKIVYSKFSNDRAVQYWIATEIIERNESRIVRKRALHEKAHLHIERIRKWENELNSVLEKSHFLANQIIGNGDNYVEFEYISGESFEQCLDEYLQCQDYKGLIKQIRKFYYEMDQCCTQDFVVSEMFQNYFGDVVIPDGSKSMPVCDIDLIFQNVIIDNHNRWNLIDYEWTFEFPIPIRYVQYRALYLYVYSQSKRRSLVDDINVFEKLGFNNVECSIYHRMEQNFQKAIKAGHYQLGDYYELMGKPAFFAIPDFEMQDRNVIKVYFDEGKGYNEEKCQIFTSFPLCIEISDSVRSVQIVPMYERGLVKVNQIIDQNGKSLAYNISGMKLSENLLYFGNVNPCIAIDVQECNIKEVIVNLETTYMGIESIKAYDEICAKEARQTERMRSLENKSDVLQSQVDLLQSQMDMLQQELDQKDTIILQQLQNIEGLHQKISMLESSVSWRMTKPIRWIGDRLSHN